MAAPSRRRAQRAISLLTEKAYGALLFLALWGVPERASAQRAGSRLMLLVLTGPMVIPVVGVLLAGFGLRITRAPFLWWFLCGLLGLNSALLGYVLALSVAELIFVVALLGQLGLSGTMLFTLPKHELDSHAKIVLRRIPPAAAFAVLPGLLTYLLFR
jgi:hypothetical protein